MKNNGFLKYFLHQKNSHQILWIAVFFCITNCNLTLLTRGKGKTEIAGTLPYDSAPQVRGRDLLYEDSAVHSRFNPASAGKR